MYCIFCKAEYFNTWSLILKEGLADFATVEIVHPVHKRTIQESMNSIASPSRNFSMVINLRDDICKDDVCVYVVSDGGYLFIWGSFDEKRTDLEILIPNWQNVNEKIFHEMYKRTTSILNKMDINYKQLDE